MSTLGDRLGMNGRPTVGVGNRLPPDAVPQKQSIIYGSFSGIDESSAPSLVPWSAGIKGTIDIEISPDNALIRAPGVLQVEQAVGHSYKYSASQTNIDGAVELLVLDPPYIGVRTAGATIWTDVGLAATGTYGWVMANHGGIELLSNGAGASSYARLFGSAAVNAVADMPPARTIASIFGRVFVGAPFVGGSFDNLRMQWSGASGAYDDWTGTGAGTELLIEDLAWADRIVALRPLGRDLLVLLLRHSIWIGVQTSDPNRPADFRSVKAGVGCVTEATARTMKNGVMFLSDDGVHLFDGNEDYLVSTQINAELLPIDFTNLGGYHAAYDPYRKRYILTTPRCTWVYELPIPEVQRPARWYKRSFVADSVFSYSDQAANPTWDDSADTWDTAIGTWDDDLAVGIDSPSRLFFGYGELLGREDYSTFTNFGTDFDGIWRGSPALRQNLTGIVLLHSYEIEYRSGGRVLLATPDVDGNWITRMSAAMPVHVDTFNAELIENLSEGLSGGLQITLPKPGTGDILYQNMVIGDGQTVTVFSTAVIPSGTTIEVLDGGTLVVLDSPQLLIAPEISGIRVWFTPAGPKTSSAVKVL